MGADPATGILARRARDIDLGQVCRRSAFSYPEGIATMARQFSGARLRAARLHAGLRPEQLALTIGRSVFSVYGYERGDLPSVPVLGAIADSLGCATDDLYDRPEAVADALA